MERLAYRIYRRGVSYSVKQVQKFEKLVKADNLQRHKADRLLDAKVDDVWRQCELAVKRKM